jgi:predicted nucleic acid-binding protein
MAARVKVFLDTSALFAGIWSVSGGAHRILKLSEVRALEAWVSPQVLRELDRALRAKVPEVVGDVAHLLDTARVWVAEPGSEAQVTVYLAPVGHPGDAQVIADAAGILPDYFVTLDRKHFLDNEDLQAALPFPIGTPSDFLEWFRERLIIP